MLLAVLASLTAAASEQELYAPAPPAGSAFVRFVNTGAAAAPARLNGRDVGAVPAGDVSAYLVAPAGPRALSVGSARLDLDVAAGAYYTVALRDGALVAMPDTANASLAKAQVTLYNLSKQPAVALRTADGAATLVDGVAPGASGQRAVNAIAVDLAVFAGDQKLQVFPGLQLAQGASYAAFVYDGAGGAPAVRWVTATTDTTK